MIEKTFLKAPSNSTSGADIILQSEQPVLLPYRNVEYGGLNTIEHHTDIIVPAENRAENLRENSVENLEDIPRENTSQNLEDNPPENTSQNLEDNPHENTSQNRLSTPGQHHVETCEEIPDENTSETLTEQPVGNSALDHTIATESEQELPDQTQNEATEQTNDN